MSKQLAALAAAISPEEEPAKENKVTKELTSKEDKFAALKIIERQLNKHFDTTLSITRLGDRVGIKIPSIPTGIPSLDDDVLGCGGIPRGRIVEVYGPNSSGKTTLCLHVIACEQANTDNLCAIVDAEHALDPTYASFLGVNVDELLVSQPSSGEEALEIVEALVDSKTVSLIVVDSVAALVPRAELEGEMGDAHMGLQARLLSQACRKLTAKAAKNNVTIVFINQLRDRIGVMYGSPETTVGGHALKFYASVRLDVRRRDVIGDKENPTGHVLRIKAAKNKCGCPMRETLVDLNYDSGLDKEKDFIEVCVKNGIIEKAGAWYSYGKNKLGNGLTNVVNSVRVNPELMNELRKEYEKRRDEKE